MAFSLSKSNSSPEVIKAPKAATTTKNRGLSVRSYMNNTVAIPDDDSDLFDANNSDQTRPDSPAIVNNTKYPIVVFLARGILYNEAVLQPNEALICTRKQTGGFPYRVHAVIGNEEALPTKKDSMMNLAKVSIVPAAFVAGCLMTSASGGTLSGPSLAMSRLVSGMVVQGVVVDAAAIARGLVAVDMVKKVAGKIMDENKELFCTQTGVLMPGRKYLSVEGGLEEGALEIKSVSKRRYKKMKIEKKKIPIAKVIPKPSGDIENEMPQQQKAAIRNPKKS